MRGNGIKTAKSQTQNVRPLINSNVDDKQIFGRKSFDSCHDAMYILIIIYAIVISNVAIRKQTAFIGLQNNLKHLK